MRRIAPTLTYLACLTWMALVGLIYTKLSPGLAAYTSEGPFFCHELQSSGAEDDEMISAFILFLLPLTLRLALIKRGISWIELPMFCFCLAVTLFALWLASLDCAEIFYTAFILPDPALAGALIALPCSAITLLLLRLRR